MDFLASIPNDGDGAGKNRLGHRARSGLRKPLNALLRSPFSALVNAVCTPRHVDHYLELLDPAWSLREVRARIVAVELEAGGAVSLQLTPNENWRSFEPGQYVRLSVRIDGVRYARCFSLSSAPHDDTLRLTLKLLPGGRVCGWATTARVGDVVELSQALGEFVLPEPLPPRLLFISGGSGITPIMAMLRHLFATGYAGEVTCLHYARHDVIFGAELAALARRHDNFRYVPCLTGAAHAGAPRAHFSLQKLEVHAPDWAASETFACGPAALLAEVSELYRAHDLERQLHIERFVAAAAPGAPDDASAALRCELVFERSERAFAGNGSSSLLEQAERAGLQPAYGCRMGICHTCKCKKVSGVVRNELTGALSSEPDEVIQLCISTPRSDVILDL